MHFYSEFNKIDQDTNYVCAPLILTFEDNHGNQKTFCSDKDYRLTNSFLNYLLEDNDFKKYVIKYFSFEGVCHWQFFPSYVWPYFFFCLESISILTKAIDELEISSLTFISDGDIYSQMFASILVGFSNVRSINLAIKKNKNNSFSFYWKKMKNLLSPIKQNFVFLYYLILSRRNSLKIKNTSKANILIFSHKANLEKVNGFYLDKQFDSVYNCLIEKFNPIIIQSSVNDLNDFAKKVTRNFVGYDNYIFFSSIKPFIKFIYYTIKNIFNEKKHLNKNIYTANINMSPCINIIMKHINKYIFKETVLFRMSCQDLLDRLKPKAVLLTYETGPVQRAAIIEALLRGIKTFGFQHGNIFSNHYDYMHSLITNNYCEYGFNIPKKMLVWGEFYKRILTQSGNYPPSSVAVVGDWRATSFSLDKSALNCEKNILIVSNGIETQLFLSQLKQILSEFNTFLFLYRPHQIEVNKIGRIDLGGLNYTKESLSTLLTKSTFVISPVSTVVLDAISRKKPVILFHHTKEKGWDNFKNIKGCFYCETQDEVREAFKHLLSLSRHEKLLLENELDLASKDFYKCYSQDALRKVMKYIEGHDTR